MNYMCLPSSYICIYEMKIAWRRRQKNLRTASKAHQKHGYFKTGAEAMLKLYEDIDKESRLLFDHTIDTMELKPSITVLKEEG